MKIVSWNVNALNVRLPHVLDYLNEHKPDVLALQENIMHHEEHKEHEGILNIPCYSCAEETI